jgi:hypothetical protein
MYSVSSVAWGLREGGVSRVPRRARVRGVRRYAESAMLEV